MLLLSVVLVLLLCLSGSFTRIRGPACLGCCPCTSAEDLGDQLGCESSPANDGMLSGLLHIGILPSVTSLSCRAASLQAEREELLLLCVGCSQLYFHLFYAMAGLVAFMGVCGQCLELFPSIPLSASGRNLIALLQPSAARDWGLQSCRDCTCLACGLLYLLQNRGVSGE